MRIGLVSDIINFSVTPSFYESDTQLQRDEKKRQSRRLLLTALTSLAGQGRYPMVVVAAGNNGLDATLAGAPSVVAEFPSQVVVVGGVASRQAVYSHSNTGAAIDLYAPAVAVGSLNLNGVVVTDAEGTSASAPLVAGTLGLVLSFDPRLRIGSTEAQAAKVKEILISGSNRSPDRINGKPVLDAYEVLRRAATEPNAPLCGNRVYRAGVDVIAERGAALETLIHDPTLSQWDYGYLNVLHDGRTIQYAGGAYEYMWGPSGTWAPNPATDSAAARERDLSSAAYNGLLGYNHGRTVAAGAYAFTSDSSARVRVAFQSTPFSTSPVDTIVQKFWFQGSRSNACDRYRVSDLSCYRSAEERHGVAVSPNFGSGAVAAVSPLGDYVVVAVNFSRQHVVFGPPRSCTQWEPMQTDSLGNDLLCADRIQADTSDHVEFFRVARQVGGSFTSLSGPSSTALAAGKTVNWIALNETAGEMVLSTSTTSVQNQSGMTCGAEEMVWLPLGSDGFAGAGAVARHPGQLSGCQGYYFGGGTFAPLRAAKVPPTGALSSRHPQE